MNKERSIPKFFHFEIGRSLLGVRHSFWIDYQAFLFNPGFVCKINCGMREYPITNKERSIPKFFHFEIGRSLLGVRHSFWIDYQAFLFNPGFVCKINCGMQEYPIMNKERPIPKFFYFEIGRSLLGVRHSFWIDYRAFLFNPGLVCQINCGMQEYPIMNEDRSIPKFFYFEIGRSLLGVQHSFWILDQVQDTAHLNIR